jgi:hypothetical protein
MTMTNIRFWGLLAISSASINIVWASTTHLGCAMALCPDSAQIWTCQYRPAGNVTGQRPY